MKSRTASMLIGSLIFLAATSQAQTPPPPPSPVRPAEAIKRILDLSDQQVQQLVDLRTAFQQRIRELGTQARNLAQQLRTLLQSAAPDPTAVGNLMIQQQALGKQMQEAAAAYRTSALALLTQTQKEKIAQIQQALQLAPQAGPLAAFGLIDGPRPGGPGRGPMGPGGPGMFFEHFVEPIVTPLLEGHVEGNVMFMQRGMGMAHPAPMQ